MKTKIMFNCVDYIIGKRRWWYGLDETTRVHYYLVIDSNMKDIIGKKVAVPINSVMLFVFNWN
jgi:hypothetical protein